jgi:amidase
MAVHHVVSQQYPSTFGGHDPVLVVAPGDTVITRTVDAFGEDAEGRQVATGDNPLTGPFFVEGAQPGDTLVVRLRSLAPNRADGYSHGGIVPGVVDPSFARELPLRPRARWRIDRRAGVAHLVDPAAVPAPLSVPLWPMLGCLGVAPSHDQVIWSGTSGRHGGNMDYRGFTAGGTAYLPVFVPGALLYLGDGHAAQGAGEVGGAGIEIPLDVELTLEVRKGYRIGWPRGEDEASIWTVGNARPLEQALQHATTEMLRWLQTDYGYDLSTACILLGQCVEYEVGNVCDPAYSMVCKLPRPR